MEEEKVEIKIQEDEVEDGRDKRRVPNEGPRENRQSLKRMTHGWDDAHKHMSQIRVTHQNKCAL